MSTLQEYYIMDNIYPSKNICQCELTHTNGGNENRNVVFDGESSTVFNKPSNPSNTVTPLIL